MRIITTISLLLAVVSVQASEINNLDQAWSYLINKKQKNQWIVISINKNNYIQCANEGDYIRCPFPVNIKITSNPKRFRTVAHRGKAYPDLPGQRTITYLTAPEAQKIKKTLSKLKLKAVDVYSKVVNEHESEIGSAHDLILILETNYKNFKPLVTTIFKEVWGSSENQTYNYDTDR